MFNRIKNFFRNPNKGKMAKCWKNAAAFYSIAYVRETNYTDSLEESLRKLRIANRLLKERNDLLKKMVGGDPALNPPELKSCESCDGVGWLGAECEKKICSSCYGTGTGLPVQKPDVTKLNFDMFNEDTWFDDTWGR